LYTTFDFGGARLWIDGTLVLDSWDCSSTCQVITNFSFVMGQEYAIRMEWYKSVDSDSTVALKWNLIGQSGLKSAIALAKQAGAKGGVAIVAVGDSTVSSGEGRDRYELTLPGQQEQLVEAIAATGTPTIVILYSGRSAAVPWIAENIPAILEVFDLGQGCGSALSEVLFGTYNPAGRLPLSFPVATGQIPVFYNYKPSARHGYIDLSSYPTYPFGYGLSYTTFDYSSLEVVPSVISSSTIKTVLVTCKVLNSGSMDGDEVAQLYIRDEVSSVTTPIKQLRGFQRQFIKVGSSALMNFLLRVPDDLWVFNPQQQWVLEDGNFTIMVGSHSNDTPLYGTLTVSLDSSD